MANRLLRKVKSFTVLLLILASVLMSLSFLRVAEAETKIISITPSSGNVGTSVQLLANMSTLNGTYVIQFDAENVTSGTATANSANASFNVPHAPEGSHNVTIIDLATRETNTTSFTVVTLYSVKPIIPELPSQLQEGANVIVSVNMTGGESNHTYPNITVQTPSADLTYTALKNITTTITGDFYDNLTYPSDFSSGASTNFTGEYKILFNATVASQFFIGLTNSSEYHRGDILNIKAVDYYPPNDNVTLTIKLENRIIDSINRSATDGLVNLEWAVPFNATIGNYNVSITPVPNSKKNASDTQIFTVPGFKMDIFTLNLANKAVPNVFVKAYDFAANTYYNATSGTDGSVVLMLETGKHTCEAFFKDVRVSEMNFTVTTKEELNFTCQLTTLNINVIDAQNVNIPDVSVSLSYNYITNLGGKENRTGADYGETGITGILQLLSMLPNITYSLNASRYGIIFNQDNNTLPDLHGAPYVDVKIFCPVRTLQVKAVDAQNQSIANVAVKAQELVGGLEYSETTDVDGTAVLNCTFGKYVLKVYTDRILLNQTATDLLQNQNITIICKFYGLNVSIRVIDYFGQPIVNANVTLHREGLTVPPDLTKTDGKVTFNNIVGGNLQIAVYLPGQTQRYAANRFFVDSSTAIQIQMGKCVVLAGSLIETGQLATAIIIVIALVLVLALEVYKRKWSAPKKSSD